MNLAKRSRAVKILLALTTAVSSYFMYVKSGVKR
jgi:hypothetical protein